MTAGTRRNGSSKFGPVSRTAPGQHSASGRKTGTGRHASPRRTARFRARTAVPAAAAAATLAAGAVAFSVIGSASPQAAQLSTAFSGPLTLSAARGGTAQADAAASSMIKVAAKAGSGVTRVAAQVAVKAGAKAAATSKPAKSGSGTASKPANVAVNANTAPAQSASATPTAAASPAASPAASAAPAQTADATTLSCDLNYSMLPENVTAIVSFLLANGYSDNAAAGIAGNIYQESGGDPESIGTGGGGLIGWTPLPSGYVTGDPAADLQTQLAAILTYNQIWASYIPALDAAASPADAAYIYVTDFERAGIPAADNREASATNVAAACGI